MTFTPGVPFDGQSLDNSRTMVRGNFTSLYDTVNENHYPPNDANQGIHKKAVFIDDSSATGTAVDEVALFPKTYNSQLQLMYRPPNTASNLDMWTAALPIRAFARFNNDGTRAGYSLNMQNAVITDTSAQISFQTIFPFGGAGSTNYAVFAFGERIRNGSEGSLSPYAINLTINGFTLEFANPPAAVSGIRYINVLVIGG